MRPKPRPEPVTLKDVAFLRHEDFKCPKCGEQMVMQAEITVSEGNFMIVLSGKPICWEDGFCSEGRDTIEMTDADVQWDMMMSLEDKEWAKDQLKGTLDFVISDCLGSLEEKIENVASKISDKMIESSLARLIKKRPVNDKIVRVVRRHP